MQVEVLETLCVANEVGIPVTSLSVFTKVLTCEFYGIQIVHFLHNLDEWLKDEVVETLPPFENWSPIIRKQPKGLVLVLG